jgi:hypothetical protein
MRNHVLNWSPGKLGKGLLMNDGSVHTWVDGEHAPQHDQYWAEKELDGEPDLRFFIGPDDYLNEGGMSGIDMGYDATPQAWQRIMAAEPRTHREGEDWDEFADDAAPIGGDDSHPGPDFNFIMSHTDIEDEEPDYVTMLGNWLTDLRGGQPPDPPLSMHHNTPEDIIPKPPASVSPVARTPGKLSAANYGLAELLFGCSPDIAKPRAQDRGFVVLVP